VRAEHVEIIRVGPGEWCICDGRRESDDPSRVLGFISETPTGYAVLALTPAPFDCGSVERWGAALERVCEAVAPERRTLSPRG
jgi:hypothetical protein